ncbi:MAG: hypothetical protein NUV98_05990 [Candidatus Roizmanbacteria bacterium]|nr:hypothetical protein [Candidatus Roizmanbacteria bacterium]
MFIQTMFSHTKEILALTVPILSVMIIVSLATAGVINLKSESTPTPETDSTVSVTDTPDTSTPVPSEVASQVEKSSTSSAAESNNSPADVTGTVDPTAPATPTTNPQETEASPSALIVSPTPTNGPTTTIAVTPTITISPTVAEGSFQFRVVQTAETEEVPVEGAKVVVKKTETAELVYEGITNSDGMTPQWKVPTVPEIDVFAYPPAALDTYCGMVLHAVIQSLNLTQPIDLTLVHSDTTEFCIQED